MVRLTKEIAKCNLFQAGQHKSWWSYAGPCACFTRNTTVQPGQTQSSYEQRHGVESHHQVFPYGALVDYMPTPNPNQDPAPFDRRTRTGLFVGYHLQPGGLFSGDYYVADFEGFRVNPGAWPKDVRIHRTRNVVDVGKIEPISFPLAEYQLRQREIPYDLGFDIAPDVFQNLLGHLTLPGGRLTSPPLSPLTILGNPPMRSTLSLGDWQMGTYRT